MSSARWGRKWADVDEEDDEQQDNQENKSRFETLADKDGIKTVIEYTERDGKTYKVTKKVKQTQITKWTNAAIEERKSMQRFGKETETKGDQKHITISQEVVSIEVSQKRNMTANLGQDVDEKFYEESLAQTEKLTAEKKVWTDFNREKQEDALNLSAEPEKTPEAGSMAEAVANASKKDDPNAPARYVPPSLRGTAAGGGKGGGKDDRDHGQEASLRVFNLSEDVKEGDLQELFGQFGRLQRVYLAKHMDTFLSKGFAFVTYYNREDGQRAINKLNGHGYDNLIMKVEWAKPRAP